MISLKESVKPLFVQLARRRPLQCLAHRSVFLARFWEWRTLNRCPELPDREQLYQFVLERENLDKPIQYVEFGVYQGASLKWWVERNRHPASAFIGFDTFQGLPEDWIPGRPKGTFSTGGIVPCVDDDRVVFEKGFFQDTLPSFLAAHDLTGRLVVHLDADLYGSTLFVLMSLATRLKTSDILIFDEFNVYMDEFRAYDNCLSAYPLRCVALAHTPGYMQVALRVV